MIFIVMLISSQVEKIHFCEFRMEKQRCVEEKSDRLSFYSELISINLFILKSK
jgi:hypothetical protein